MKTTNPHISCFLLFLATLFCYAPAYAEESFNERSEQVEETIIFHSNQQQKVSNEENDYYSPDYRPMEEAPDVLSSGFGTNDKLYILYSSLRFCD
jgi:hypothetical protein